MLIAQSQHESISQCMSLFLNIETSKNIPSNETKMKLKQIIMRKILDKIDEERKKKGQDSAVIVENLAMVIH